MSDTPNNIQRDQIFADPIANLEKFAFDQKVVDVFPDMIRRSVPGYTTILHMIGQLASRYAQSGTRCYDLGCSLGAATLAMRHAISQRDTTIVGVDNSSAMLARCRQVIDADAADVPVELVESNIQSVDIKNASICVSNFTLQFVPLEERQPLLEKIFHGMTSGGVLVLSEKISFEDQSYNNLMRDLHHQFKRLNGYSELEIAQKRDAIENVLIPQTLDSHTAALQEAGFSGTNVWFQCFNFCSLVAFKH